MVIHTCDKCQENFSKKSAYISHINRINPCNKNIIYVLKKLTEDSEVNEKKIDNALVKKYLEDNKCVYCEKQFYKRSNVLQHMRGRCKEIKKIENEKKTIFDKLKELEATNIKNQIIIDNLKDLEKKNNILAQEIKALKKNKKENTNLPKINNMSNDNNKSKAKKQNIPKKFRILVWDKYIGLDKGKSKCLCCDEKEITQMDFECGHIIAEANGGQIHIDNLIPLCNICNNSMATKNYFVFKKELNDFKNSAEK
jgi:hypothetical protein